MEYLNRATNYLESYFQPRGMKFLSFVGFLYLTYKSFTALHSFARTFLPIGYDLSKRYGPGSWAIVTGAAQGIGQAFAVELASKGFKLVLIDLNEEKLAETSTLIQKTFPDVQLKTIVVNFGNSTQEGFFDSLMDQLKGLDISILINNVGIGAGAAPIYRVPESAIIKALTVNLLPITILSRKIIPLMLNREQRSAIINLSSISGVYAYPYASIYGSTKAYIDFFSRAIEPEVGHKIDVLSVRPDLVSTPGLRNPPTSSYVITPESLVKSALRKIGKVPYAHGNWRHEVKGWLCRNPLMLSLSIKHTFRSVFKLPDEVFKR